VDAPAEHLEHLDGVRGVPGLAEQAAVHHDLGVGPEDQRRGGRDLERDHASLGERQGRHRALGRARQHRLRDMAGRDGEWKAEAGEELPASRRGGSQDQRVRLS